MYLRNCIGFTLLLLCNLLFAQQRSVDAALQIASEFGLDKEDLTGEMRRVQSSGQAPQLVHVCKATLDDTPYYYVFNKPQGGYVIVSGDERAYEVLGYSDSGSFEISSLPANMKEYLDGYVLEIETLSKTSSVPIQQSSELTYDMNFKTSVAPLLGQTQWNQSGPYNLLCPMEGTARTVAGCVAVAMAQVMFYHKWPLQGQGSMKYTSWTTKIPLEVDFSQSIYDWDNITPRYNSSSATTERNAVAKLVYDCGVAVKMDYSKSGSGAQSADVAAAMVKYFGYDADAEYIQKKYYTHAEWTDIIKSELNANRPVYHGGQSLRGGHAFVCDGYNEDDFFHFNWGWGGSKNGYFRLFSLAPGSGGIGAGSDDGYNDYRCIVVGVQKPDNVDVPYEPQLLLTWIPTIATTTVKRDQAFDVTFKAFYNSGARAFKGLIGSALYDDQGNLVQECSSFEHEGLRAGYGWSTKKFNQTLDATIPDGKYHLHVVYKVGGQGDWKIVRGKANTPNSIIVDVKGDQLTLSTDTSFDPKLNVLDFSTPSDFYCDKTGYINLKIKNEGVEYTSGIKVILTCGTEKQEFPIPVATIFENDTFDVVIKDKVEGFTITEATQATLKLYYDPKNRGANGATVLLCDPLSVMLHPSTTEAPALALVEQISFANNDSVPNKNAELTFKLTNTGGYTVNNVYPWIFPENSGVSLCQMPMVTVYVGKDQEQSYTSKGDIDLPDGTYRVQLQYKKDGKWAYFERDKALLTFNLVEKSQTRIMNNEICPISIYPNPTIDRIQIDGIVVKLLTIYNLHGDCVLTSANHILSLSNLPAGKYIVFVVDEANKHYVQKIIKQ